MKTFLTAFSAAALSLFVAAQAEACQGAHGYTKTAQLVEQSTLSSEKKAALMQVIEQSKADHDKYTAAGDYGKMHEAVQELSKVKQQVGQ